MNNKRVFRLNFDLKNIDKRPEVVGKVKQLDGTRIIATLTNDGEPMDLSDCLARLFIIKPNKEELYQKEYITINENTVVIECVDEIFELNGDVHLELEIIDLDGYIETFQTFLITVIDKINDDTQREIIRVEEISLLEELKDYILSSQEKIDGFKEAIDEMVDPDYLSLLGGLGEVRKLLLELNPVLEENIGKLDEAVKNFDDSNLEFNTSEEERVAAEVLRVEAESARQERENERAGFEATRQQHEEARVSNEESRVLAENLRANLEESRQSNEVNRTDAEGARETSERLRETAELNREASEQGRKDGFEEIKEYVHSLDDKIADFPNHGDFNVDVVVKGNLYTTLDGVKPTHFGPPSRLAGNVIMPYSRALGGMTKDGSGVRTIGFISKPTDADSTMDITEDQNIDSVFLGTNVSQLFLYSKEKYPTIVSDGELSPIATQDWVMRLVDGLGLLDKGEDETATVTSKIPSEVFDIETSDGFIYEILGDWSLDDFNNAITYSNGDEVKYKPLIAYSQYNEITYSYNKETSKQMFIGLWRTENYIYGARIDGRMLSVSYFDKHGTRGGSYNLTIRENLVPGEKITVHYNHTNEIWEFYKYDENQEPILIYQLSKFMMSGFPEFYNGREVRKNFAILMRTAGQVHFHDGPDHLQLHSYVNNNGYSF